MTQVVQDAKGASAAQAAKGGYLAALPILAVVAGFLSTVMDMAEPLAPFTLYAMLGAGAVFVVLLALFAMPGVRRLVAGPMMFAALIALFSGAMWAWQTYGQPEDGAGRGAIVAQFPALGDVQERLGLIQQDLSDVADNTERTAENTDAIRANTAVIAETGERSADALDDISEGLEGISEGLEGVRRLGGIIDDPESVSDFINNAVVYEERGDALNARRMYERAVALGAPYVDVHDRYAALLKAQEGLLGAREIYADIAAAQADNPPAQLTAAKLTPLDRRSAALSAIAKASPDFAPVYMAQFELYDLSQMVNWTLTERAAAQATLERFAAAHERRGLQRWYLNDDIAEQQSAFAGAYLISIEQMMSMTPPVSTSIWYSGYDWAVYLSFAEKVQDLHLKRPDADAYEPVEIDGLDVMGQSANFTVDGDTRSAVFQVRYTDANGEPQGPYDVVFDVDAFFGDRSQSMLNHMRDNWVGQTTDGDGTATLSFYGILGEHCGIGEARYGVDTDIPDTVFPIPACTMTTFHDFPDIIEGDHEVALDALAQSVSVQLIYTNGETSPVRIFDVRLTD